MKPLKLSYCTVERKACIRWIERWFKDCLCNIKDEISFGFGIAGLVCWAVAEIPQIITNFQNKSANGVSLTFLSTWIIGDVFNLVGCILEPATLPTQFYTAVLYTTVTVILALQCIYYEYFFQWWKCIRTENQVTMDEMDSDPLMSKIDAKMDATTNIPVEVPNRRRDFHFMSARSLAGSNTPPIKCYLVARSGPPILEQCTDSSDDEEEEQHKPLTKPISIPRSVKHGAFLAASANFPHLSRALKGVQSTNLSGISLLFLQEEDMLHENAYGEWLGWLMAAIYMGGRIPQIWLNIKRGSVEGLNPLMFIFALVANATYVASILVRTTEWRLIKANLPWLLDAIVCVALDLFIILQYIFYKYIRGKTRKHCGVC